jgi:hypothetical protein
VQCPRVEHPPNCFNLLKDGSRKDSAVKSNLDSWRCGDKINPLSTRVDHNSPLVVFVRVYASIIQLVLHIIDPVSRAFFCYLRVFVSPRGPFKCTPVHSGAPIVLRGARAHELAIAFHFCPVCKRHARRDRIKDEVVGGARRQLVSRKMDGEGLFLRGRPQHDNLAEPILLQRMRIIVTIVTIVTIITIITIIRRMLDEVLVGQHEEMMFNTHAVCFACVFCASPQSETE